MLFKLHTFRFYHAPRTWTTKKLMYLLFRTNVALKAMYTLIFILKLHVNVKKKVKILFNLNPFFVKSPFSKSIKILKKMNIKG